MVTIELMLEMYAVLYCMYLLPSSNNCFYMSAPLLVYSIISICCVCVCVCVCYRKKELPSSMSLDNGVWFPIQSG